jgi:hypothetical protein
LHAYLMDLFEFHTHEQTDFWLSWFVDIS